MEHEFVLRLMDQSTDRLHVITSSSFCSLETASRGGAFAASRSFVAPSVKAGTIPAALTLMSLTCEAFLRPRSSQHLPFLPCLLIALASGGCRGSEHSPPCRSLKDDFLLLTETSGTQPWSGPDPTVNVQLVQAKTNTPIFVPNGGTTTYQRPFIPFLPRFAWEDCVSPASALLFSAQY